jgi:hypothetical protein
LFVIAHKARLRYVDVLVMIGFILRAIADDVCAIVPSIAHLKTLAPAFRLLKSISGIVLNAPKCVMVRLGKPFKPSLIDDIRFWLSRRVSEWANMAMNTCGKYLGFQLGPSGASQMWTRAVYKCEARADIIATFQRSPNLLTPL